MSTKAALVSGAGIAGPAVAYWLLQHDYAVTLVEQAQSLRRQGYIIDFWGAGYDLVERMGLLPQVLAAGYDVQELRLVDQRGGRVGGIDGSLFKALSGGRYTSLSRADLSAILYRAIEPRCECLFSNSITGIDAPSDANEPLLVHFAHGLPRQFELVVGADGLHSNVRKLAFGPEDRYQKYLGYLVAAFEVSGYPHRDEQVYVSYSVPGSQVARFGLRDDRTMFLIVTAEATPPPIEPHDLPAQKAYLRRRFAGAGWECEEILAALERTEALYFDQVSQIHLGAWSKGRVVLVGDAAYAPSLLAGQGSALAIIGAYVLAGELARAPSIRSGLANYESRLRGFMASKQRGAERFAASFAPRTALGVFLRNQLTRAMALRPVAKLAMRGALLDRISLPDY